MSDLTPGSANATGPTVRGGRRTRSGKLEPYDFRRPTALSREHNRTLQVSFETFARQGTTVLTSTLRAVCQLTLNSVEQQTYAEYVAVLPQQTYLSLLSLEPIPGAGVLDMPIVAAMACVDHLLGGHGGSAQPDRPLTEIEDGLVRTLNTRLLAELTYAFDFVPGWEPAVTGVEYSPQFAQAAAAADACVVATFELVLGEITHDLTLCLPLAGLVPHLVAAHGPADVSDREQQLRRSAAGALRTSFSGVPVELSVRFRSTLVDPAVLVGLALGDVIRLAHPAAAPLDVKAGEVVFAHATPGTKGRQLACLVASLPPPPDRSSALVPTTTSAPRGHQ